MSSFWRAFLVIFGLLSKYIISPDPLFISESDKPELKLVPKLINLVPSGLVVIPEKLMSIAAEKLEDFPIMFADATEDSNSYTFAVVVTPT